MAERTSLRLLPIAAFCLLMPAGCASSRSGPFLGQQFDDPPHLSPYNQPLNAEGSPAIPDQQITEYRSRRYPFFGPGTTAPAAPSQTPYDAGSPLDAGRPQGGVPLYTQPMPTPATGDAGGRPAEPGRPPATDSGPEDDLGTRLGAPRTYREDLVPGDPDAIPTPIMPDAGETIRQRPDSSGLSAPHPSGRSSEPKVFDPFRQPLELTVTDPQQTLLSETAKFEVVIRNRYSEAVEDVVIVCRFDDGLSFPGLPDRALRQRLGTLGASETRTLDLSLTADQLGRHCVDFTLSGDGRKDAAEQRCVEVVDPQTSAIGSPGEVAIELVGPAERNAGGRLECLLTIQNRTGREASAVVAAIHYDAALVPREASAGAVQSPGTLTWDLGLLQVDERVQIEVEFECPTPSQQACIDAEVTGRNLPTRRQDLCVVVHPPQTLDVAIADARDPVPVGETTTYLVTLTNRGLETISGVRVDVEADGGLVILPGDRQVSEVSLPAGTSEPKRSATFLVSEAIKPDQSRQVRIDVRGRAAGTGGLRVVATELATRRRIRMEEPTVINPPLLELPSLEGIAGSR